MNYRIIILEQGYKYKLNATIILKIGMIKTLVHRQCLFYWFHKNSSSLTFAYHKKGMLIVRLQELYERKFQNVLITLTVLPFCLNQCGFRFTQNKFLQRGLHIPIEFGNLSNLCHLDWQVTPVKIYLWIHKVTQKHCFRITFMAKTENTVTLIPIIIAQWLY